MSEYLLAKDNKKFGVPEQKKFPMPDADHVKSAIKFFNYVEPKFEKQLAKAILRRAKEFGVDISEMNISDNNRFKKYLPNDELKHHGILGQKWGIRRYQNADGTYTEAGKKRKAKEYIRLTKKNHKKTFKKFDTVEQIRTKALTPEQQKEINKLAYDYAKKMREPISDYYLRDKYKGQDWLKKATNKELAEIYRYQVEFEDSKKKLEDYTFKVAKDFLTKYSKKNINELYSPISQLTEDLWGHAWYKEGDPDYYRLKSVTRNLKERNKQYKDAKLSKNISKPELEDKKRAKDLAQMEYDEVKKYIDKKYE